MSSDESLNRTLRHIVISGVFLFPFIAFVVTDSMFFPFITGKNIVFRLLVELVVGAWTLLAVRSAQHRPKRSWIGWAFLGFLVVMGVATVFGVNPTKSFFSVFERMEGYVTLLHLGAYMLVVISVIKTEKLWRSLLQVMSITGGLMAVYGLFQIGGVLSPTGLGASRVAGTFGNATYLAVYMLFHVFITLFLMATHNGKSQYRWAYGVIAVLQTFILFQTATRGTVLGLFGGLLLTAILIAFFERERQIIRKVAVVGLAVLVICAGLFFIVKNTTFVQETTSLKRIASISIEEKTARSRLILWSSIAWDGFKERPLLGWGQENFSVVFSKHYDPRMFDQEPWFDRAHNVVLDWLLAGGILGLVVYLSLFVAALYHLWSRSSGLTVPEKSILTGLLAGYFFHNLFVFDNIISYILFITILSYIHVRSTEDSNVTGRITGTSDAPAQMQLQYAVFIFIPVLVVFSAYGFVVQPMRAAQRLLDAIRPQDTFEENLSAYRDMFSYGDFVVPETLLHVYQTAISVVADPNAPDELKRAIVSLARDEGVRFSELGLSEARDELFLGIFLSRVGLTSEGLMHLERALSLAPDKQQVLLVLSQYHSSTGNPEKGLEFARRAYELEPSFEQSALALAVALIQANDIELADQILMSTYGTVIVPHSEVINAFGEVGNIERVKLLWEARVLENPSDIQNRISYAAALQLLGDIDGAIEQVEAAIAQDLNFKAQGEIFIEQLRAGNL